jgi:hypothetical protein
MRILLLGFLGLVTYSSAGGSMAQEINVLELSRASGVMLATQSGSSKGSGFFVGDQYVLTCFHVVAALSVHGSAINWSLHPDLHVSLPSGETIRGTVISVPTPADPSPLVQDFAFREACDQAYEELRYSPTSVRQRKR